MRLCSIASGSSGNCIYVGEGDTHLLIDAGISGKRIELGLKEIGVLASEVSGLFITHEHSDHIKGIGVMARRHKIPIYATQNTWQELMKYDSIGKIDASLHRVIRPDESIIIGSVEIMPFQTPHDAVDPVAYTFRTQDKKIAVATDLGCYNDYIVEHLKLANVLFIEANHDVHMLEVGGYPYFLKRRILSDVGHLSNETSGKLIAELCHETLSHIVLGHLSLENNYEELAYESVKLEILHYNRFHQGHIQLTVAKRDTHSDLIEI